MLHLWDIGCMLSTFSAVVTKVEEAAQAVNFYTLARADGLPWPDASPGSHIDLHLDNGIVRQYSLMVTGNGLGRYVIGVKREQNGRGGSQYIFDNFAVGTTVQASAPRNAFPLVENAAHSVFIAGGIGITPIWAMIQHLQARDSGWELHYACRTASEMPLRDVLGALPYAYLHLDDANGGLLDIAAIAAAAPAAAQFYCCGPAPMLSAFQSALAGRSAEQVHFESFLPTQPGPNARAFGVHLARSNKDYAVPATKSILDVLRESGHDVPYSCEQGVCGSCETAVISGSIDHQDSVLSNRERAEGKTMMICCSRAKEGNLVLDL